MLRPDPTKTHGRNAEVGGDELEWYPLENVGGRLKQVAVSFLCTVKLQTFKAIDRFNISCFKYFSEQTLNVWIGIIKPKQRSGLDGNDFRCFQHLYSLTGSLAAEKALDACNDLIFKCKALRNIHVVFEIIDTCHALFDKINGSTGVPNRLQVLALLDDVCRANGLNGRLRSV